MKILNQREYLSGRRELRERSTVTEDLLWSRLRRDQLGIKFRLSRSMVPSMIHRRIRMKLGKKRLKA